MIKRIVNKARREVRQLKRQVVPPLCRLGISIICRNYRKLDKRGLGSILIMSPSKYAGGLGDEAMLVAACEYLQGKGFCVGVLIDVEADQPQYLNCFDKIITLNEAYSTSFTVARQFISILEDWDTFGVFGADVIDGAYNQDRALGMLSRIHEAQSAGLTSQLFGSSLKDSELEPAIKQAVRAIGEQAFIFRDRISRDRFEKATGFDCGVVADAAFLLRPRLCSASKPVVEDVKRYIKKGDMMWGLNTNWSLFSDHIDRQTYVDNLVRLTSLVEKRLGPSCVVLLPHDTRQGEKSDFSVAKEIGRKINSTGGKSLIVPDDVRSYSIKKICESLRFVVTSRMHVAVAALGVGCPAISISYQGKFEGLYDHFGLDIGVLDKTYLHQPRQLSDYIAFFTDRLENGKSKIISSLPEVRRLSEMNFNFIQSKQMRR